MHGELLYLTQRDFTPAAVHAETQIHQGSNISDKEISQGSDKLETQGDAMIGTDRLTPSFMSNLATLMRIPTDLSKWRRSWIGGKKSIIIITVSTATINGKISSVFSF